MIEIRYLTGPLADGFFCRSCKVFNGDAKEFRTTCRACEAPRPTTRAVWAEPDGITHYEGSHG